MKWFGPRLKIQIGVVLVLGMCMLAIFAPLLAPHDPYAQNLMLRLRPPVWDAPGSWTYPLGTDNFGRDLLSRLIYGSRLSIVVGLMAMLVALTLRHDAGPGRGLSRRPHARAGHHALRRRLPGDPRDPAGDRRGRGVRRRRRRAGAGAGASPAGRVTRASPST